MPLREISAAQTTLSSLPSSCWTGTFSGLFARKLKTNGGPFWSPPITPPTPSTTCPSCTYWADRGRVPHSQTSQSPLKENTSPPRRGLKKPSTRQFAPYSAQHDRALRIFYEGPPPPPSCGPLLQAVRRERRRSGQKEGGLIHRPGS